MAGSIRQMSETAQGFKESTRDHVDQIKARISTFRSNIHKMFTDEDADYDNKSKEERNTIQDKAFEKLGAYCSIITAEADIYRTFKSSLRSRYVESSKKEDTYPATYTRALTMLNETRKDKRQKHQTPVEKLNKQVEQMRSFLQATDAFRCFICGKHECKGGAKCSKKELTQR